MVRHSVTGKLLIKQVSVIVDVIQTFFDFFNTIDRGMRRKCEGNGNECNLTIHYSFDFMIVIV